MKEKKDVEFNLQVELAYEMNQVVDLQKEKKNADDELTAVKVLLISVEEMITRFSPDLL